MTLIKKWRALNQRQKTGIVAAVIAAAYFITRLYNILGMPIFNDEAIYIRWAELFRQNPAHLFVSLTDGKQPSYIWAVRIAMRAVSNPLLAGRLISVFAGLVTITAIFLLAKELFNDKRIGIAASLTYLIYPYSLVYDRMALYDSMVAMFAVLALYLEILLVRRQKISLALITAVVVGGGLLTKSSALFFIYLLPFSLLLFNFKTKQLSKDLLRWVGLALVVVVGAMAIASVMRLSHNYAVIATKNNEFTLTIGQWLHNPFVNFQTNSKLLINFIVGYSTIPLLLLAFVALVIDRKFIKEKLLLLAWVFGPLTAMLFFAKLLYPRYILFMMMPLLPLVAYAVIRIINRIKIRWLGFAIVLLLFVPVLYKDYLIVTDFSKAPVPERDRYAYSEGFYSGIGINQAVDLFTTLSQNQKIYIATEGGFGIMPYGIQDYVYQNKNIEIQDYSGVAPEPHPAVMDAARRMPTYYVFNSPCSLCESTGVAPKSWPTKELLRVKRIEPNSYLTVVQILPN